MNLIFENLEFILAAILLIYILWQIITKRTLQAVSLPGWLTAPAVAILHVLGKRYTNWLTQMQIWSAWRHQDAFANFAALKIYSLVAGAAFIWLLSLENYIFYDAVALLFLFFLPDLILALLVKRRQESIREALPQMIDLLILCVDAGLAIDAAVQKVASDDESIISANLNEELMILCRDILLGADREKAYTDLFNRTGVEELRAFGSSLNQSQKLGLSIARILRSQAQLLRVKLARKIDERASKLPIYMSFPLWFCIMPALLIVLLGPALIQFFSQLRGGML